MNDQTMEFSSSTANSVPHQIFLIGSGNKKIKHAITTHKRSIGNIIFEDFYLVIDGLVLCECLRAHILVFLKGLNCTASVTGSYGTNLKTKQNDQK